MKASVVRQTVHFISVYDVTDAPKRRHSQLLSPESRTHNIIVLFYFYLVYQRYKRFIMIFLTFIAMAAQELKTYFKSREDEALKAASDAIMEIAEAHRMAMEKENAKRSKKTFGGLKSGFML